jgi:hypothetical protein
MRANISLWLALRFFLRPLLAYCGLFWLVSCCVFSLFLAVASYEYQVDRRFSSKQPHLTLSLDSTEFEWRQFMDASAGQALKEKLQQQENVLAVSEFSKVRKWLRLNAATSQMSAIKTEAQFDKFSVGDVTIIGLERTIPAVIPLSGLNYYDAGLYKFKITNLEFVADWLTNPHLVIPNAVLDASFFPPISQQVTIKSGGQGANGQVKGFLNDYNDESILYVGLDVMSAWVAEGDVKEQGIYITLVDSSELVATRKTLQQVLTESGQPWLVTSWLDEKSKQKTILLITKLISYTLITLLVLMLLLVLILNQTRVFIEKAQSLRIFYMTGYLLTRPLSLLVFIFSLMGVLLAYLLANIWIAPMILQLFGLTVGIGTFTAWWVILFVAFMINVTSILSMQNRLVY